jgi:hypothetical protein
MNSLFYWYPTFRDDRMLVMLFRDMLKQKPPTENHDPLFFSFKDPPPFLARHNIIPVPIVP